MWHSSKRNAPFPTLPLDVIGTPFQRPVWDELCAIPLGPTCSYGEMARRISRPEAPRAVGAAVGANPVSILIPCHRALARDGSLHNYRYGIERKRRLLLLEGARTEAASPVQHRLDFKSRRATGMTAQRHSVQFRALVDFIDSLLT